MAKDVFGPNSMGGSVNTNSLGFAYIDLGVNINPMKVGITAALGALQAYMIKAQTEMDTAMRNIWTLVDTSYNQIMKYQDQIYQLSREIPRSAQDLANGMYWIISATIPAADALTVLEAAAKSAVAGLSTTYKAADVLTDIINAYGYAASDAEHISDILFRTVERGKLTYDGLAGSLGKVVATAAAGNVPLEELAAAMATMTQIGLSADESSTALNRFILSMIRPTNNATKAANELGLEWDAAALSSKGLVGMMQALDEATGGNIETMTKVVPEIRSLRAVLALARDSAESFAGEVERMNNANGAMQRAFEKQADSIKNTLQNLQNAFFEFSSKMGQVMTPAIKAVANGLSSVFEWMANLPSATKEVLAYTILASTAFSTLSGTIMKLISSIGKLSLATMGPTGWIAAIGLVFALIVDIIAKTKDWNEETSRAAEKQGLLVEKLKDSAQSAGSAAKELESLISDYEKLSSKSEKTKEEQEKLNTVVAKIADIAPNVVSSWNDMGVAIGINIDAAKVKLKELYSVQRSYAQMTLNAAQAQQAAMASAITKIDASLPKLNAEFEKIQSLYQLGNIPGLYDKKTQDRILALGVRANEGLVKSMDDAIAYVAGSDKAFSDAIYAALKDAPKFIANWTKLSFDEQLDAIFVLAEAKAKEGQSKLEQIADFSASKAEYAKLSFEAANAAATVQGLDETLSKLGDTANTNTNVAISETIDKLDELKTKIEAINTFGTYPERPLSSLKNAKKQLQELLASYPTNENDPTGKFHEERKLIKDALYSIDKEITKLEQDGLKAIADAEAARISAALEKGIADDAEAERLAKAFVDPINKALESETINLEQIAGWKEYIDNVSLELYGFPSAVAVFESAYSKIADTIDKTNDRISKENADAILSGVAEEVSGLQISDESALRTANIIIEQAQKYISGSSITQEGVRGWLNQLNIAENAFAENSEALLSVLEAEVELEKVMDKLEEERLAKIEENDAKIERRDSEIREANRAKYAERLKALYDAHLIDLEQYDANAIRIADDIINQTISALKVSDNVRGSADAARTTLENLLETYGKVPGVIERVLLGFDAITGLEEEEEKLIEKNDAAIAKRDSRMRAAYKARAEAELKAAYAQSQADAAVWADEGKRMAKLILDGVNSSIENSDLSLSDIDSERTKLTNLLSVYGDIPEVFGDVIKSLSALDAEEMLRNDEQALSDYNAKMAEEREAAANAKAYDDAISAKLAADREAAAQAQHDLEKQEIELLTESAAARRAAAAEQAKASADMLLSTDTSKMAIEELASVYEVGLGIIHDFGASMDEELFQKILEFLGNLNIQKAVLDKQLAEQREELAYKFASGNFDGLLDIWQGISDTLGMASRGEYKGITGSLQALNDIFNPMIEFGKNYWKAIQEQMATGLDFAGAMDFLNNGLIKKLKESGEGVGKVLLQIGDYLKDTGIKAVDNIGSAISSLGSNLSTSIGGFFVEFGKYVINMIIDKFTRGLSMLDRKAEWSGEATDDKGRYQWLRLNRDGTPNPEGPDRSVRYWNEEKRRWEAWQVEKDYYKKLAEEEAKRRPAFQISEISGPMRDTIVTALSPLNQLNSMPSYVDRIVYAIREVRDIMSSAQTSSSIATASIQQTFNIQQVNILAPESSTFSSILADLDKQSRLAVAATGG